MFKADKVANVCLVSKCLCTQAAFKACSFDSACISIRPISCSVISLITVFPFSIIY